MDEAARSPDFAGGVAGPGAACECGVASELIGDILSSWPAVRKVDTPVGGVPSRGRRLAVLKLTIAQLAYEVGLLEQYGVPPAADRRFSAARGGGFGDFL